MRFHPSFAMAVAATAVATGVSAQAFEGVITQKMSAAGMNAEMVVYVKGDKMRQELSAMGMAGGAIVIDGSKNEAVMLMSEMKMYMRFPTQEPAGGQARAAPGGIRPRLDRRGRLHCRAGCGP